MNLIQPAGSGHQRAPETSGRGHWQEFGGIHSGWSVLGRSELGKAYAGEWRWGTETRVTAVSPRCLLGAFPSHCEACKSSLSVVQAPLPLPREGSGFPGSRQVRSCQAGPPFLPRDPACPAPFAPPPLGLSLSTVARFRELCWALAQMRHLPQQIREWGAGRGLGDCQGYREGHLRPACFLLLSAGGSLWDSPRSLKNILLGPGIEGSGWWQT